MIHCVPFQFEDSIIFVISGKLVCAVSFNIFPFMWVTYFRDTTCFMSDYLIQLSSYYGLFCFNPFFLPPLPLL